MTNSIDNMDSTQQHKLRTIQRNPWVEFILMRDKKQCLRIAQHFTNSRRATLSTFQKVTGIDLTEFINHYMEIGGANSLVGPIVANKVKPILTFKRTKSGYYRPIRLELDGFYHQHMERAWVKTEVWEEFLGDSEYFERHVLKIPAPVKK